MAVSYSLLFILSLLVICVSLANAKSFQIQSRIVNGAFAKKGDFPYMVSLYDNRNNNHICGGAILNERYILSAAVCFKVYKHFPHYLSAEIGSVSISPKHGVHRNITKIEVHPKYRREDHQNDLAILQTLQNIIFTEFIKAIALPTERFNKTGVEVYMSGFGADAVSINYYQFIVDKKLEIEEILLALRNPRFLMICRDFHLICECISQSHIQYHHVKLFALSRMMNLFVQRMKMERVFAYKILATH